MVASPRLELRGNILRGANLSEAYLKGKQVPKQEQKQWTHENETTELPEDLE